MLNWLLNKLLPGGQVSHPARVDYPGYPPWEDGLPIVPPAQLIEDKASLVTVIRESLGTTPEFWDTYMHPMLMRVAAYVQLLPASEPGHEFAHHFEAGGLLTHLLETCRWALHFSAGRNPYQNPMLDMDANNRAKRFQRWRVGVAVAALCHDIGKPITDTRVVAKETGERWRPNRMSMYDWAQATKTRVVGVEWIKGRYGRHMNVSTRYHESIIGNDLQDWIADVDESLWNDVLGSTTGEPGSNSYIADLVIQADRRSTNLDRAERARQRETYSPMTPAANILQQLMLKLAKSESWTPNQRGSRVWVTEHGVFLVKAGLEDIQAELRRRRIASIIDDVDAIADNLVSGGYAIPSDPDNDRIFWRVAPEVLRRADGDAVTLSMLKIARASYIFGDRPQPDPVGAVVTVPGGKPLPVPAQAYRRGGAAQPPAPAPPPEPDHADHDDADHDYCGFPDGVDEIPVSAAPAQPPTTAHPEGEGSASPRQPKWEAAALAEELEQFPDLFALLTTPAKVAMACNLAHPPKIFLRIALLREALGQPAVKALITPLAKAGVIEPYSGFEYSHDVGEASKSLLLDTARFGRFHPFLVRLTAEGERAFSAHEREIHARLASPAVPRVRKPEEGGKCAAIELPRKAPEKQPVPAPRVPDRGADVEQYAQPPSPSDAPVPPPGARAKEAIAAATRSSRKQREMWPEAPQPEPPPPPPPPPPASADPAPTAQAKADTKRRREQGEPRTAEQASPAPRRRSGKKLSFAAKQASVAAGQGSDPQADLAPRDRERIAHLMRTIRQIAESSLPVDGVYHISRTELPLGRGAIKPIVTAHLEQIGATVDDTHIHVPATAL